MIGTRALSDTATPIATYPGDGQLLAPAQHNQHTVGSPLQALKWFEQPSVGVAVSRRDLRKSAH